MSKQPDLYSFSSVGLPAAEPSTSSLPPIVDAMFSDLEGTYADDLRDGDICTHPQMVAAITAQCNQHYLSALVDSNIEAGAAAVYGALAFRGTTYVYRALNVVADVILEPANLSRDDISLLVHACDLALSARDTTSLDPKTFATALNNFRAARDLAISENRLDVSPAIESKFNTFARYREIIDEIKRATDTNAHLDSSFFSSIEPSTANYMKGLFGLLSKSGSDIQKSALEYFARLDPALLEKLKFGLEHNYMRL